MPTPLGDLIAYMDNVVENMERSLGARMWVERECCEPVVRGTNLAYEVREALVRLQKIEGVAR